MLFKTGCLGSGRRMTDNYFSFILTNAGWTGTSNVHPIPSGLKCYRCARNGPLIYWLPGTDSKSRRKHREFTGFLIWVAFRYPQ
jgi:hypothetical protein